MFLRRIHRSNRAERPRFIQRFSPHYAILRDHLKRLAQSHCSIATGSARRRWQFFRFLSSPVVTSFRVPFLDLRVFAFRERKAFRPRSRTAAAAAGASHAPPPAHPCGLRVPTQPRREAFAPPAQRLRCSIVALRPQRRAASRRCEGEPASADRCFSLQLGEMMLSAVRRAPPRPAPNDTSEWGSGGPRACVGVWFPPPPPPPAMHSRSSEHGRSLRAT